MRASPETTQAFDALLKESRAHHSPVTEIGTAGFTQFQPKRIVEFFYVNLLRGAPHHPL